MATYYDKNEITVTDAVFMTPKGDQYPIRNISGVMVRQFNERASLIIGILGFVIGVFYFFISMQGPINFLSIVGILIGIAGVGRWYLGRKYVLFISSGGIHQQAITFPIFKGNRVKDLQEISNAINSSISNLQKN